MFIYEQQERNHSMKSINHYEPTTVQPSRYNHQGLYRDELQMASKHAGDRKACVVRLRIRQEPVKQPITDKLNYLGGKTEIPWVLIVCAIIATIYILFH